MKRGKKGRFFGGPAAAFRHIMQSHSLFSHLGARSLMSDKKPEFRDDPHPTARRSRPARSQRSERHYPPTARFYVGIQFSVTTAPQTAIHGAHRAEAIRRLLRFAIGTRRTRRFSLTWEPGRAHLDPDQGHYAVPPSVLPKGSLAIRAGRVDPLQTGPTSQESDDTTPGRRRAAARSGGSQNGHVVPRRPLPQMN